MNYQRLYWIVTSIVIPVTWIVSLTLYHIVFRRLYRTIEDMSAQLTMIFGKALLDQHGADTLFPSQCFSCGAVLMGGATQHKEGCEIQKIIERHFPRQVQ